MLNHVRVKNFRLFDDFSIDNLARVNLIVGKNNVGKSSLLEALYLLVSENPMETVVHILNARGEFSFHGENAARHYDFDHLFFGHNLQAGTTIYVQAYRPKRFKIKVTFINDATQLSTLPVTTTKEQVAVLRIDHSDAERQKNQPFVGYVFKRGGYGHTGISPIPPVNTNYITTKSFNYDDLAISWDKITLTPKEDDVINMLQIIDPTVERLSFQSRKTSTSGILLKRRGHARPVPLGSMGDGMHRILAIATALATSEDGYLFVDEIDTGLHYRTITDMWNVVFKTAAKLNVQVFATTHSSDCIDSFNEALNSQQDQAVGKLFRLERRGDKIEAVTYNNEELMIATEQEIEVR